MRPVLIALLLLAASPATALAATVSVHETPPDKYNPGAAGLTFLAGEGERNDVTLTSEAGLFVVRDAGAPLTPGAGCSTIDAHAARCLTLLPLVDTTADLRYLDDTLAVVAGAGYQHVTVFGSDGHDVLSGPGNLYGGPGPDVLTGSAGPDTLSGGAGDDLLRGLEGDDVLSGDSDQAGEAARGNDLLDGGAGVDTASYAGRTAPVGVNLAVLSYAGEASERDQLVGVESVVGGGGADVLSGDAGPNGLDGGGGNDVLAGRDGDDLLRDGPGTDLLLGGAGNDALLASGPGDRARGEAGDDRLTGATDAVLDGGDGDDAFSAVFGSSYTDPVCGAGLDRIVGAPQHAQRIAADCEDIRFNPFDIFHAGVVPLRRAGHVLSLPAGCGRLVAPLRVCDGMLTLRLRRPGRTPLVLGRRHFVIDAESSGFVRVLVRRAARATLARIRRPLLDVDVKVVKFGRTLTGPGGVDQTPRASGRWTVRLP